MRYVNLDDRVAADQPNLLIFFFPSSFPTDSRQCSTLPVVRIGGAEVLLLRLRKGKNGGSHGWGGGEEVRKRLRGVRAAEF
jgi:hypothetical protein